MAAPPRRLLLLFGLFLLAQAVGNVFQYLGELQEGGRFGGDFISFWSAARHLHAGEIASIYDPKRWQLLLLGGCGKVELSWFVYPPFALFGLRPLGGMPYGEAVLWWSLLPLPAYAALLWPLARRAGLGGAGFLALVAFTLPFVTANLFTGQTGMWVALALLGAAWCWGRHRLLAGLFIGLLAIKPQLGLLLPVALAAAGQWRTFAAATATVTALAAASALWLGTGVWNDYLAMTALFGEFVGEGRGDFADLALGPYVSLQALGLAALPAAICQAAVTAALVASTVRLFRDERCDQHPGRRDLRLGMLAIGALLATPYSLSYDTPLLTLALVPLFARVWRGEADGAELAAVVILPLIPFAPNPVFGLHLPLGLCALLFALCVLGRRYAIEIGVERFAPSPATAGAAAYAGLTRTAL